MTKKVEVTVPSMGESVQEVVLTKFLVQPSQVVEKDEEIAELETDKVNQVLYAPSGGMIEFCVEEDSLLKIGDLVAKIDPSKVSKKSSNSKSPTSSSATSAEKQVKPTASPLKSFQKKEVFKEASNTTSKEVVKEEQATNSLEGLRIDLSQYVEEVQSGEESSSKSQESVTVVREISRKPLPKIRKVIAQRLHYAKLSTAMLTTFNEVDMSQVMQMRSRYKESFEKKHGVKLGFMSFFVKAVTKAIEKFPGINSYIEGDELVQRHYSDISIAVSTEKGLMVPVLRSCEKLSFAGIEKGILSLAEKAREGRLSADAMEGGGFTITNGGVFGSLLSTPILNPPQSGILGMHTIQKRPVVVGDDIVVRPMMYVALSYDHRVVDGKEAVGFLVEVKKYLEEPSSALLEL